MDWTIVSAVLMALLLWPVVLMSLGAIVFLTVGTVLRARVQGLMESKMAHCKEMFSREVTTAASPAVGSCCGRETPEGA